MEDMILIIIDECGDEIEHSRYRCPDFDGDEDAVEIWKMRKVDRAWDEYPEARSIYMEDRRGWNHSILMDIREWF